MLFMKFIKVTSKKYTFNSDWTNTILLKKEGLLRMKGWEEGESVALDQGE